jgi:hypothetical protein
MKVNPAKLRYRLYRPIFLVILAIAVVPFGACAMPGAATSSKVDENTPVIHFLIAEKQVNPAGTLQIRCLATGNNGDALSYKWSATGGEIQGEGDSITWLAPPAEGDYAITVVVSNDKGSQATGSVNIEVTSSPPQYPVVKSVTCEDCRNGIEASRYKQYTIQCDAEDPNGDKLTYQWLATMGKFETMGFGEGSYVTWHTSDQSGNALIKVIVTNTKGKQAEGYLSINISCCH